MEMEAVVLSFQTDGLNKWVNQPQIGATYLLVEWFDESLYNILDMISYEHSELNKSSQNNSFLISDI